MFALHGRWMLALMVVSGCMVEPTVAPASQSASKERGGFADLPAFVPEARPSLCSRPLMIGHRGSRIKAPENTLPAFLEAMRDGGDGVEMDVRLTRDGVLVVMHDETTGATTDDAQNRRVADLSLEQVKALDAGSWFGEAWAGARVPTVDEVIDALPGRTWFVFDLRSGTERAIVELIERRGIARRSIAAAFDHERLAYVHAALPELEVAHFLHTFDDMKYSRGIGATYVRVPIDTQEQEATHWRVVDAGFLALTSSTYLTWNLGMVFVNDMKNGLTRLEDRRPAECTTQAP